MKVLRAAALHLWLCFGWVRTQEHKLVVRASVFQHKVLEELEPEKANEMIELFDHCEISS